MKPSFDARRFEAFSQLLAQRDPPDMPRRTHVFRCAGDPSRRATRLPGILMAWLQRRHLEADREQPHARATHARRRSRPGNPTLRVLRPTGTGG